jgi:hypothetical protein
VLQLTGEELRGHRRLAVRREGQAVPLRVRLQEGEVGLYGLGGQGQHRGGEPAREEVAALGRQRAHGQPLGVGRQRLEAVVDPFAGECRHGLFGGLLGGQGGLLGN